MSPSWTGRWPGCPPVDTDPQVRFLHACRAYLVKDWEQLVRHTEPLLDDPLLGIEAGLFGGMARVRLEMYGQAEPLLSAALMRCRSEQPQRKELRYWLARAHEGTGRSAAALPLYRAVHRVDPAFMDTSARLAAIAEGDGYDDGAPTSRRSRSPGVGQDVAGRPGRRSTRSLGGRAAGTCRLPRARRRRRRRRCPPVTRPGGPAREGRRAACAPQPLPAGPADPALLEEALAELERMVGLEPVKRQVQGAVGAAEHGAAAGRAGPAGPAAEAALRLLRPLRHRQDHRGPHPRPGLLRARAARRRPSGGGPAGRSGRRVPRARPP